PAIPAIAFVTLAAAMMMAIVRRPGVLAAIGLGVAISLGVAAGPMGFIDAAISLVALLLMGVFNAIALPEAGLRIRVWWVRRGWLAILAVVVAIAVSYFLVTLLGRIPLSAFIHSLKLWSSEDVAISLRRGTTAFSLAAGAAFYWPFFALYEFTIVSAAVTGVLAIVFTVRSLVAGWCLMWAIFRLPLCPRIPPHPL